MRELRGIYRLQLSPSFTFGDAAALADYVADVGFSHVHLSPCFQARQGSPHGYDVVDPTRVRDELGGEDGLLNLAERLRELNVGIILDFVPNHMAAWHENPWWWDALARGRESRYAHFFDIDWDVPDPDVNGRIVLPLLPAPLEEVVERGDLRLDDSGAAPVIVCGVNRFPVAEGSLTAAANGSLTDLLRRQHYVLTHWQRGAADLNYRRFANVAGLVGVRVEDQEVFESVHGKVLELAERGAVDGLRIDHIDGLRDPQGYLEQLRSRMKDGPIFVEKVLTGEEHLRKAWPVQGTTGYDFLNRVGALFVDGTVEEFFDSAYAEITGNGVRYDVMEAEKRRLVLEVLFPPEFDRLARSAIALDRVHDGPHEDSTLSAALRELAASFPVYRTYVRADSGSAELEDAAWVDEALRLAAERGPHIGAEVWFFLRDLLLLRYRGGPEADFAARFQQLTGPVAAKGVEDTAFYCYNRLISLNEVGGDPRRFGSKPEAFHTWCLERAEDWPESLSVVSTHDTKRSADARLRISLLSEIPDDWVRAVRRWSELNERHRTAGMPDGNDEYLLYQALVGTWPIERERVLQFARKAVREAKRRTAWITGNDDYDRAVEHFVEGILSHDEFTEDLEEFVRPLREASRISSLAHTLLHMTAAGTPQVYRGDELWSFSLVDPDNRRPVDFNLRREILTGLSAAGSPEDAFDVTSWGAVKADSTGASKLRVIRESLAVRARHRAAFAPGSGYVPLLAYGPRVEHVVGFERRAEGTEGTADSVVSVAPRLVAALDGGWEDTLLELPGGEYVDVFTGARHGGTVGIEELLSGFPVALLESERSTR